MPMEVMGLMLGEFVDAYTVRVVDVFAMPQSGTGVSVEAVDPVFQTKMMEMLVQTGRLVATLGRDEGRASAREIEEVEGEKMSGRCLRHLAHLSGLRREEARSSALLVGADITVILPSKTKARDRRRLVPLAPGLRLLAVVRRHQHAAIV